MAKAKVKLPAINRKGPGGSWPTKKQYWRTSGAVLTAHSPAERGEMFADEDHPGLGVPIRPRDPTPYPIGVLPPAPSYRRRDRDNREGRFTAGPLPVPVSPPRPWRPWGGG